jgi:hypothetical protein
VHVRVDLTAQDATYYFVDGDRTTSLAAALGSAIELADAGRVAAAPGVRSAAAVLHRALDDLAHVLDEEFLRRGGTTTEVLAAWAADHGYGPG